MTSGTLIRARRTGYGRGMRSFPLRRASAWLAALAACSPADVPSPPGAPTTPAPSTAPPVAAPAPSARPPDPLAARVAPVTEAYFGVSVTDPYRWMETDADGLKAWMEAQDRRTRATLLALPLRAELRRRVHELSAGSDEVRSVGRVGSRTFFLERKAGEDVAKLYVVDAKGATPRVLLDPGAGGASGGRLTIDDYWPSPAGTRVVCKLSPDGSETGRFLVIDTKSGKPLSDVIDRSGWDVAWLDERTFLYDRLQKLPPGAPESDRLKRARTFEHVLGRDAERDPAVFGTGVSKDVPIADEEGSLVIAPAGSTHLVGIVSLAGADLTVYVAPRGKLAGAATPWVKVVDPERDQASWVEVHRDRLVLLSHKDAPHFAVLETPFARPDMERAHAHPLVPASDVVIERIGAAEDALYLQVSDAGIGRLLRVPYGGGAAARIPLPIEGTMRGFGTDPAQAGARFTLESWAVASRSYEYDPAARAVRELRLGAPGKDFDGVVAEEVTARSADGTQVPLSIVHGKDLPRDGSSPTWLRGYGAYGRSEKPFFVPQLLAWLERGGVFAVCHARGGGERGDEWHRAGMLLQKQHTIDDVIACAQELTARKISSPETLAIEGSSAGGVAAGGALVQHPELFGAALLRVGLLDTLRIEQSVNVFNVAEFGSTKTEDGFRALYGADAYLHVQDGVRYPSVLLTTGVNDSRVAPWMVTKMAARLQAASASDRPVLLRVSFDSGHFATTQSDEDDELADEYAFLFHELAPRR